MQQLSGGVHERRAYWCDGFTSEDKGHWQFSYAVGLQQILNGLDVTLCQIRAGSSSVNELLKVKGRGL